VYKVNSTMDINSLSTGIEVNPDDKGPAILGKEPVIGELRREQGVPVIRDEIKEEFNL